MLGVDLPETPGKTVPPVGGPRLDRDQGASVNTYMHEVADRDPEETREWLESLEAVVQHHGKDRARFLLKRLLDQARRHRVAPGGPLTTDFVNTIPVEEEAPFPGDQWMEKRIRRIIRWNAMARVHRANVN